MLFQAKIAKKIIMKKSNYKEDIVCIVWWKPDQMSSNSK